MWLGVCDVQIIPPASFYRHLPKQFYVSIIVCAICIRGSRIFAAAFVTLRWNKCVSIQGPMGIEGNTGHQWWAMCVTYSLNASNVPCVCGSCDKHKLEDSLRCRQCRGWNGCDWYADHLRSPCWCDADQLQSARGIRVWRNCHPKRRHTKRPLQ